MLIRQLLLAALVAALPAAAGAQGAQAAQQSSGATEPAPRFPETAIGLLGKSLVDAVNSGDSATIHRAAREGAARYLVRGWTADRYARMLVKLAAQSGGGLELVRVEGDERELRVFTRPRRGTQLLGIEVVGSAAEPGRYEYLGMHPMDDPRTARPTAWPAGLGDVQKVAAIRDRVRESAAKDEFSGVILVAKGDSIVVHDVYGMADGARGIANGTRTRYDIMSAGKMFTAVAIAQLVQQGKLRFEDTLATVLPEYPNREAARRVTIHQLLTHTAGIPDVFSSPDFAGRVFDSHLAMLPAFARGPLELEPGSRWSYSNGGFATLGAIIERVSGLSYEEYLRRNVFGPAHMDAARAGAADDGCCHAVGHARFQESDPLGIEPRRAGGSDRTAKRPRGTLGAFGGGTYTAEDLFRFLRALRNGVLLDSAMTRRVVEGKVPMNMGPARYAYGFFDRPFGTVHVVGHSGSNPDTGYDADVELVWDGDWTVIVLANYDAPAGIRHSSAVVRLLTQR